MAGDEQQFCLRWNNFPNNFASQFDALRHDEAFVDVTLTCEGRRIEAHKLVLSACSPYFKQLFKGNPCKHPIMFLHNVEFRHLKALVEFMYVGEVNVAQTHLPAFLRTAESLQIRGLADNHAKFTDGRPLSSVNINSSSKRRDDNNLTNHLTDSNNPDDSDDFSNSIVSSKRLKHSRSSMEGLSHNMQGKLDRRDFTSDLLDTSTSMNPFIGLETTVEAVNNSGLTLQGALDAATAAGPSSAPNDNNIHHNSNNNSDSSTPEGEVVKPHSLDPRPCPECGRVYSNISNLRQHIRLIHYPECIACPLCFKPFKNKLYLKRHLISYHELLPPSYMEKRYNYNTQTGSPVFTYKSQPPDGFVQRHNSNGGSNSANSNTNNNNSSSNNNNNNSNNNSNNNNNNTSSVGNEHHHQLQHLHHHPHLHQHHPPTNHNRDSIMNHISFPHANHIMPVQAVLSSPPQNFYPPNGDFSSIPNESVQQAPPTGPNDHGQVHMTSDPSGKQQTYSPQPQTQSGPPTLDEATSGSDMNANNSNK